MLSSFYPNISYYVLYNNGDKLDTQIVEDYYYLGHDEFNIKALYIISSLPVSHSSC